MKEGRKKGRFENKIYKIFAFISRTSKNLAIHIQHIFYSHVQSVFLLNCLIHNLYFLLGSKHCPSTCLPFLMNGNSIPVVSWDKNQGHILTSLYNADPICQKISSDLPPKIYLDFHFFFSFLYHPCSHRGPVYHPISYCSNTFLAGLPF